MKSYTITVNGTAYEVTVEENGNAAAPVAAAPKAAAPAPKAAPAAAPKAAAPAAGAGSVKVSACLLYTSTDPDTWKNLTEFADE